MPAALARSPARHRAAYLHRASLHVDRTAALLTLAGQAWVTAQRGLARPSLLFLLWQAATAVLILRWRGYWANR